MENSKYRHDGKKRGGPFGRCARTAISALLALGLFLIGQAVASAQDAKPDAKTIATTTCAGCHGEDGNSVAPMFPKLAGLQVEYIDKQLREFISGRRKSDMMAPIAAALKPADIHALALYFSSQTPTPAATLKASNAEDTTTPLEEGRRIFMEGNEATGLPACEGCHRPDGSGAAIYPRLAGQHRDYLLAQLKAFNAGARSNDESRFMRVVAQRMTEQEMKAVVEYISALRPQE